MKKISLLLVLILVCSTFFTSCKVVDATKVATINGENISKSVFNFYLTQVKSQLQTENTEDYWTTAEIDGRPALDVAKEQALEEAAKMTIVGQKAKEMGIKLSQEDKANLAKQKSNIVSQMGGQSAFEKNLSDIGITKEEYQSISELNALRVKLITDATDVDDEGAKKFFDEDIVRVKHILIMTVDPSTGAALSEEQLAEAKKKAEDILAKAKDGEDFDSLVAEYSEDPGSQSQPDGYYLGKGFALGSNGGMVEPFETASLALKVDEISDIVETSYGYHIIKRYANDDSVFDENKDEITYYAQYTQFEDLLNEWYKSAVIDINEKDYNAVK